jgi:membrane protease YdiL (CAAX protease family)
MRDQKERVPIGEYLGWTFLIAGLSYGFVFLATNGIILKGKYLKIVIVLVDTLVGTFSPMHAVYILFRRSNIISGINEFFHRIIFISEIKKTIGIISFFCIPLLIVTMVIGTRTNAPWFIFVLSIPLMVIAGGVEEVGWRGFLQPALEEKLPFIVATLVTATFWMLWHLPLWFIESSSQASFDWNPYMLNLVVDSFILSTIYALTKSLVPCIFYHAWGNALGTIYEWNIFATQPVNKILQIYYLLMVLISITIRIFIRKNTNEPQKKKRLETTFQYVNIKLVKYHRRISSFINSFRHNLP